VLLFPAEDSLAMVRARLSGICAVAGVDFNALAVDVITAPALRLDTPEDCQRLTQTVERLQPRLLILDPLIRLHRVDENDASQIAALLSFLRQLQRRFGLAILVVHHARKDSHSSRPGQALRGSSELHGWGDSNLYLRRRGDQLTLCTEHRAAPSQERIALQLTISGTDAFLSVQSEASGAPGEPLLEATPRQRVLQALGQLEAPVSVQSLRQLCGMRTATLCTTLAELTEAGSVIHDARGYQLRAPMPESVSLSRPIGTQGNGNGKHD
jgi:hypothetical protein